MNTLAEIAAVHAEAFEAPWSEQQLAALTAEGAFAIVRGEPADGFILLRVAADEAEILTLAVRPQARRRGVARSLVEEAKAAARDRNASSLFLEVAVDNEAGLALYRTCGFSHAGLRRGYYARRGAAPVDALVLRCALNTATA